VGEREATVVQGAARRVASLAGAIRVGLYTHKQTNPPFPPGLLIHSLIHSNTQHDKQQSSIGHRLASTAHPALAPEDEAQMLESKVRRIRARMLRHHHHHHQQQQQQQCRPPVSSSSLAVTSGLASVSEPAGGDGSPAVSSPERAGKKKGDGGLGRVRIFATTWNMGGGAYVCVGGDSFGPIG
jgi:hypothetical protein